jgi:glycosyltransferase involved in cell wall biosynthesis
MSGPDVSVCMPAHRDTALFPRALHSVLRQDHTDLEVLVSDDSGGALRAAVEKANDPRIGYLPNQTRLGFTRNHTATLDRARGRFLAFLHDDDRWLPRYLSAARACFDADPGLGLVSSAYLVDRGRHQLEPLRDPPPPGRHDRWLSLVMRHGNFIPSTTVLRREVWDDVRRDWPDVVIGDLVLWIDSALAGWSMLWQPEPLAVYRYHPDQISADKDDFRHALVTVLGAYEFRADPEAERLRRWRLARAHLGCAGLRLHQRRPKLARADLSRARAVAPWASRGKRLTYTALSTQPWLLPVAARVRDLLRGHLDADSSPRIGAEPRA